MRSRRLLVGIALLAAAALGTTWYFLSHRPDDDTLLASGTIEATDVDVSFQIGGRVAEVLVEEGQAVKAGEPLARLAPEELTERVRQIEASLDAVVSQSRQQERTIELRQSVVENQILQARSEAEAADIARVRVREGLRPQEIKVVESDLAQAEAALVRSKADFERFTGLLAEGIVPRQQYDSAEAALRAAQAARDAAFERLALANEGSRREDVAESEARLRAAQAGLGIAESGRKEIDVQRAALAAAQARERELRAQLDAAKTQLQYTEIRSPRDAVVLTKNVESGEVVNPGTPVVTVADIDDLWMNVYIPETQTGLVQLGQTVGVRVDSFPSERFEGKVTFVSAQSEFTPKTILTQEERIKLVYRVKVSLENTGRRLKPGMPADAEIRLK